MIIQKSSDSSFFSTHVGDNSKNSNKTEDRVPYSDICGSITSFSIILKIILNLTLLVLFVFYNECIFVHQVEFRRYCSAVRREEQAGMQMKKVS